MPNLIINEGLLKHEPIPNDLKQLFLFLNSNQYQLYMILILFHLQNIIMWSPKV